MEYILKIFKSRLKCSYFKNLEIKIDDLEVYKVKIKRCEIYVLKLQYQK